MRVREAGSLALGVAFALTLGVVSSPAAAQLDEARRLYDEAEFEPALTALDRAAEGEGLALADAVALLELRAELHLALEDAAAIDRDFVQLVTIAPDTPSRAPRPGSSLDRCTV